MKGSNLLTRNEFNDLLKEACISKKQFAEYLKTSYNTVNAWGSNGREVPYWVKSWLRLYIAANNGVKLKTVIKKICNNDNANWGKISLSFDEE